MSETINIKRPDAQVGDHDEVEASIEVEPFDQYGRHHEVTGARATVGITRVTEGVHLDIRARATVRTTCDRTLEPLELELEFGDADLVGGPRSEEFSVEDWELYLDRYASKALPNEVPMQVFAPNTEPLQPQREDDGIDPRWRKLDDLFASGF